MNPVNLAHPDLFACNRTTGFVCIDRLSPDISGIMPLIHRLPVCLCPVTTVELPSLECHPKIETP
jgi:hypothetical protein